jgi:hypothetical protein
MDIDSSFPIPPTVDIGLVLAEFEPYDRHSCGTALNLPLDMDMDIFDGFGDNDGENILDANMGVPLVVVKPLTVDAMLLRLRQLTANALSKELCISHPIKNAAQWKYAIEKIETYRKARSKNSWKYSGGWQRFLDSKLVAPEFPTPQKRPPNSNTKKRKGVQDSEQSSKHGSNEDFSLKPHEGNPKRQCSQVRKLSELLPLFVATYGHSNEPRCRHVTDSYQDVMRVTPPPSTPYTPSTSTPSLSHSRLSLLLARPARWHARSAREHHGRRSMCRTYQDSFGG